LSTCTEDKLRAVIVVFIKLVAHSILCIVLYVTNISVFPHSCIISLIVIAKLSHNQLLMQDLQMMPAARTCFWPFTRQATFTWISRQ